LTQNLCSQVWENCYDNDPDEVHTVTIKYVETAIPNTLDASRNTLEWLWDGLPPTERVVISALASAGTKPIGENELEHLLFDNGVRVVIRELQNAPRLLQDWDLIELVNDGYRFRVELFRRWVTDYKPLNQVQEESNHIQPLANNLYQAGVDFYSAEKLDEAIPILRLAIKLNPNCAAANQLLVEILLTQNKISEARELLKEVYEH
jgi:tetratricopeptide (TPR) repeat protein